jgi:hypothetical protein
MQQSGRAGERGRRIKCRCQEAIDCYLCRGFEIEKFLDLIFSFVKTAYLRE